MHDHGQPPPSSNYMRAPTYLRLDQDQVYEQHDKVMLDIFVPEPLAPRALCQPNTLAQGAVVRFAVGGVERAKRISALYTYGHVGGTGRLCGSVLGGGIIVES